MPTKITVNYPQPITVKVDTGEKDRVVQGSAVFVGSSNNFLPNTGGTITGNLIVQNNLTVQNNFILLGNTQFNGNTITRHIIPSADQVYDIGTPNLRFRTLYLSGNTIDLGGGIISASGNTVTVYSPAGGLLYFNADANTSIDAAAGVRAETTANLAFDQANTSIIYSTASYYYSGQAISTSQEASNIATAAYTTTNAAFQQANLSTEYATAAYYYSAAAVYTANDAATTATSAAAAAQSSYDLAYASYYYSGVAINDSNTALQTAQTAAVAANTAYEASQTAIALANTASEYANLSYQIATDLLANSNTIVRVTGGTLTGSLVFLGEPTANLTIGPIQSSYGLDIYSTDGGYSQINYSNIHVAYADTTGVHLQTPNASIGVNASDDSIEILSTGIFTVKVGGIDAISVYPNNDIYFNGTIYGAPTALDGGDF